VTQNIIYTKDKKKTLNRAKNGSAVVKISSEAADIVEKFVAESNISISKLVSTMIIYASDFTMIKEGEKEDE
jgi:hypothetical protein